MDRLGRRTFLGSGAALAVGVAGCTGPETMYEGSERRSVPRGEYAVYQFDLVSPATLAYDLAVVEGGRIDVLVTKRAHFDAIEDGVLDRYSGTASVLGADDVDLEANLMQGAWTLLLDNSGLVRAATGTPDESGSDPATAESGDGSSARETVVEFGYEVTKYIPYGSGRD